MGSHFCCFPISLAALYRNLADGFYEVMKFPACLGSNTFSLLFDDHGSSVGFSWVKLGTPDRISKRFGGDYIKNFDNLHHLLWGRTVRYGSVLIHRFFPGNIREVVRNLQGNGRTI